MPNSAQKFETNLSEFPLDPGRLREARGLTISLYILPSTMLKGLPLRGSFTAVGCSDSDTDTPQGDQSRPKLSKIEIPDAELSATVEGQPLPDVDLTTFQCYNESDFISLHGQDPTNGQPGLAVNLQPGNPPKVESVSFGLDGVLYTAKAGKTGSASGK